MAERNPRNPFTGRSESATKADEIQEGIVYRSRVYQIWGLFALLAVGVGIAASYDVRELYILTGVAAWLAFVVHHNFTQVLHELFELNDQLAGRKDEFKTWFSK